MLISLNTIKQLVDIKIPDDELFKLIGSRLVEIERVEDLSLKYKKIYVAKVLECADIEGTHLHLCKIDAGPKLNSEIDPEHKDYIQVVCGAPNVHKDMLAAWIAPGAIVPTTVNTPEPFEISARKLRGFMSHGMLAAADELALGEDHEGIISLDPNTAKPGDSLADALNLNDKIIEVENKSLTHRPDCFGAIGFAREVAGILGQPFSLDLRKLEQNAKIVLSDIQGKTTTPLKVNISDYNICPRYEAYIINLETLPTRSEYFSPSDVALVKAGMRPISPIVDITNLIMLMTGQPLHAFDYNKFIAVGNNNNPEIGVRLARDGEKLTLLDGKESNLIPTDIVITSGDVPVALAGAMGGKSTEIDESTKKIIVEIASFSLYNLRKTQMAHGIFSEAITRFTKGRPASDLALAANFMISSFIKNDSTYSLNGSLDSFVVDYNPSLYKDGHFCNDVVEVTTSEINSLLGSEYSQELIQTTLENVGFKVEQSTDKTSENTMAITVPHWRTDIHIKEDIIEEVARLLGFDNLPLTYPSRPFICPTVDPMIKLKTKLRNILSDRLGANELLTYSFVSESLQEKVNENPRDSYRIINSISPNLECFRQSIVPSLLDKIRENLKSGYKEFTLYELNQVTRKSFGLTDENVPRLETHLGLVSFGDFYHIKQLFNELEHSLNISFDLRPGQTTSFFEPLRTLDIILDNTYLGTIGEIKSAVLDSFKLQEPISAIELNLEPIVSILENTKKLKLVLSRFPFVSRDITLSTPNSLNFASLESTIKESLDKTPNIIYKLKPTSIYQKTNDSPKNISFHLEISHEQKTLNSQEISAIIEQIVNKLATLGVEVV